LDQVGDDPRFPCGPEALEDGLQVAFTGVNPPASEPETLAVTLGCSDGLFNRDRHHLLPVGLLIPLLGLLLLFVPPVFPKPADRLIRCRFQQPGDIRLAEPLTGEVDEASVIPLPITTYQEPPSHPCGEQEAPSAIQSDDLFLP